MGFGHTLVVMIHKANLTNEKVSSIHVFFNTQGGILAFSFMSRRHFCRHKREEYF